MKPLSAMIKRNRNMQSTPSIVLVNLSFNSTHPIMLYRLARRLLDGDTDLRSILEPNIGSSPSITSSSMFVRDG